MFRKIRSSLQWKLVSTISLIIFFVIGAIGSFSYYKSMKAIDADVVRFSDQILKQASFNLNRYINENEHFFQTLAESSDFQDWAGLSLNEAYMKYFYYKNMESHSIDPFISYHPETLAIVFYSGDGYQNVYRNPASQDYILKPEYSMKDMPWFQSLTLSGQMTRMVSVSSSYSGRSGFPAEVPVLTYVQKFRVDKQTVYLQIDISLLSTQVILDAIELGGNGSTIILDETGTLVSSPDPSLVGMKAEAKLQNMLQGLDSGSFYREDTKQMIVYQSLSGTGWKVVAMVPYSDLARSIVSIRNWTTAMVLFGMMIAGLLVFLVAASITKRLKLLRKTIGMTRLGRLDVRVDVKGNDEVAELGAAYNHLLERIDVSIHRLAESRTIQQQAILSALQAQINSHFLYNALESINSMANLARHRGIQETAIALSDMLRYTSNYHQSLMKLEDEMKHLEDYIRIMKVLYREDIQFTVELEDQVKGACCLKAIVQPFVENCVKHGYETTAEPMAIRITARRYGEKEVMIDVVDNGRGIPEEKREELQAMLSEEHPAQEFMQLSRIGVLNVHYRLKTYYNNQASGVFIERSDAEGTHICIRFPLQIKEGVSE